MFIQSGFMFSAARRTLAAFAFLAVLLILSVMLVSCNDENVVLNPALEQTLNKNGISPGPVQQLVTGLQGASGSAIGPGGALFVAEGAIGRISRVDPKTGTVTTFASGFPPSVIGIGGVIDVAFIGKTAYALVTLVDDALFPTGAVNGIYRVDGPNSFTIIANIGAYNIAHPPTGFDFFVGTGVLYSIQTYRDGFLVTDGHLNRVLYVKLDGNITQFKVFENIVPTGLEVHGNTVYMAEAGPVPHLPENGKVVSFGPNSSIVTSVASGARLLVDVEFGRGQTLFALSQGFWEGGPNDAGTPAQPNTGSLVRANADGTFTEIIDGLDRPTSLEFIGNTAYIVTLTGEIWTVGNVTAPPFGSSN